MKRVRMAAWTLVLAGVAALAGCGPAGPGGGGPNFEYPAVQGYGGVVRIPGAAEPPRAGSKLVVDVTAGGVGKGVNAGLEKVARFANLYAAGGVSGEAVGMAAVVHGDAVGAVVERPGNEANVELLKRLRRAGVEVLVCGQSLIRAGHRPEDVADGVTVATSALAVLVNRQADGYAYVQVK